ncbi:aldehyde dehydrogenase family protein [Streptomyces sp. NPDC055134]
MPTSSPSWPNGRLSCGSATHSTPAPSSATSSRSPQYGTITSLIEAGLEGGAHRVTGTQLPARLTDSPLAGGRWVVPTLLDGVTPANPLETTEVFDPVVGADAFDSEAEAIARPTPPTSAWPAPSGPRTSPVPTTWPVA